MQKKWKRKQDKLIYTERNIEYIHDNMHTNSIDKNTQMCAYEQAVYERVTKIVSFEI